MSSPPAPTGRPAKSMSSRLMTMKFMQRAASSAAATSTLPTRTASTSSQKPHSPPSASSFPSSSHPSKRSKPSPSFSAANPFSELQAMREALAAEEAKRSQALDRQAANAGHETKWVLSTGYHDVAMEGGVVGAETKRERGEGPEGKGLWVRRMGYSEIDDASSDEDENRDVEGYHIRNDYGVSGNPTPVASNMMGRRSFGRFNRALEKRFKTTAEQQSSSSSDEGTDKTAKESDEDEDADSDDSNDPVGANDLIRTSKKEAARNADKQNRKARQAEAAQLAMRRRSKDVKLNRLSSISGGGGGAGGGGGRNAPNSNVECYNCGEKGHVRMNCPKFIGGAGSGGGGKLKRKGGSEECSVPKRSKTSGSFP